MKTFFVFSLINGPNNDDNNTGELQIPLPGGYVFAEVCSSVSPQNNRKRYPQIWINFLEEWDV